MISGDGSLETVFWFHGSGEDGKTQVTHLCEALVGEQKRSAVAVEKIDDKRASILLYGKLLNIADEVPKNYKISDAIFKRMTGNSLMTGDPKHRNQVTFKSKALWIIPSNHFPNSADTSHGYHRRFKIFRFRRVPKNIKIKDYFNLKLRPELSGICQLLLTQGRELFETQGFVKTVNEEKSLNEMKSKNSVFAYWQHVVFHNKKEHKEAIHKIYMDNLAVFEVPNAMQEATAIHSDKEMERIYNHVNKDLRNIESMRYYDLILQYNTGAEGIIWIVNIDEHYELYKKHFENDEARSRPGRCRRS